MSSENHVYKYTLIFPSVALAVTAFEMIEHAYDGMISLNTGKKTVSVDRIEEVTEDLHCMGIYDFQVVVNPLSLYE